jgi:uncharacterized protein (DUF1501 family)
MDRRDFLRRAALAGTSLLPVGRSAWAAAAPGADASDGRLVVILLRGAVDGLSVVVPYADADYRRARASIALERPGSDGGVLDLDGRFGLHPALAPLLPHWQSDTLAFVHASGSSDPTRSHFDAQDYMESGTPGRKSTPDGWMNRLLGALPGGPQPTTAVNLGPLLPRALSGPHPVATLPLGRAATRPVALNRPQVSAAFDRLYGGDDALSRAYREAQTARQEMMANLGDEMQAADNGAPLPNGFAQDAQRLARLMRRDGNVRIAFASLGGWDTHVNQGNAKGQLANRLQPLGEGLDAFVRALGTDYARTAIVVLSEFGRTVRQNGTGGTDHGHGNVMWLLGGRVNGGKVHGEWPGLADASLYQGRDLAITTDFRSVLARVLGEQMRLPDATLAAVFPALPGGADRLGRLFRPH